MQKPVQPVVVQVVERVREARLQAVLVPRKLPVVVAGQRTISRAVVAVVQATSLVVVKPVVQHLELVLRVRAHLVAVPVVVVRQRVS